jgi:pimeloyl-ACP methyl ester carboxylesterase
MPRNLVLLAALVFSFQLFAQAPAAITADPAPDKAAPAAMEAFQLPSHGSMLNALFYEAAGAGPHGTVVMLHGFPGNEKNLDLAQAIRRDGWNVLYFDYRGSWGSPGTFSFEHSIEDAQSALVYLRDPANAKRLHSDPSRIVLFGHSMGGMIALYTAAHDGKILAVGVISAADMAGRAQAPAGSSADAKKELQAALSKALAAEGMAPLAGCTPDGLAAELVAHPEWALANDAVGLKSTPLLIVTSDDGLTEPADKLAAAVSGEGNDRVLTAHIATDHSYSDKRIKMESEVLRGLDAIPAQ